MAKKPKSPGKKIDVKTGGRPIGTAITGSGPVYIGVDAGSDLEKYGYQSTVGADPYALSGPASFSRLVTKKPLYKVGYQNSKTFARELNDMDPNMIYLYQQRLSAAGILGAYTPGQLDKATRAAFKELLTRANQTGATWQQTLQDVESVGGMYGGSSGGSGSQQQPAQIVLDDPVTLRSAFQQVAQQLYGGDLPDNEVNQMVDAYRSAQLQKAQDTSAVTDSLPSASDFAQQQLQQNHPDQLARVKFSDTLGNILDTLRSSPAGGA